jgi:tRNA nucleotidyltransferase/poly(A) polymerase
VPHRDPGRVFQVLVHHPAVGALVRAAAAEGVESHLVGGVLRDRLLGLPSRDLDGAVSDRGAAVGRRMAEELDARLVHLGGRDWGAYRLVGRPAPPLPARPSRVGGTEDERAAPWVLDLWDREGSPLEQDLARRDFTVNSLALSLPGGRLVDSHGGLADLRHRLLRATTPESFTGDPLRVLRLPRLLVQLPGFAPEPGTLALAREAAPALAAVASERVREELALLFAQPDAHRGVAVLGTLDLYPGLWLGRPGEPAAEPGVLGRLCGEMERMAPAALRLRELAGGALPFRHRLARLALTFAHLEPAPGSGRGPARDGEAAAQGILRVTEAGYLTKRDAGAVARVVPWHRMPGDGAGRRRFLHRLGELWTTAACYAGARATGGAERQAWERAAAALVELYRRKGPEILEPPRLLDGREVAEILGVPPGPEVGEALRELKWAQVEGRVTTRAEAVALVEGLAPTGRSRRSSSRPP